MKKSMISFIAILLAVICFAFTIKRVPDGPGCNESLYWFEATGNKICTQVTQADLIAITDSDGDGTLTAIDYTPRLYTANPYGCEDQVNPACALGFRLTSNPATNQIESFLVGDVVKFRPIASKVSEFRCCVKKKL
jgi:hypothetical protein